MEYTQVKVKGRDILSASPKQDREFRVATYDFKRPDKFSLDQIRTVSIVHETFCRLALLSLSDLIKKKVQLHVRMVDQLNWGEFIQSIPNPTTIAILNMTPLKGSAVLEIDPGISSLLTDRMFGGQGEPGRENRELTGFERSMMEIVTSRLIGNLRDAWTPVITMTPTLGQIETNSNLAQIVPPSEMVILISMEISIGDEKGFMNICLPYLTIEPIIGKLSAQYWYSMIGKNQGEIMHPRAVSSLKMDSEIISKTEMLSLKQIGALKKGSLVRLDDFARGISSLRMGGKTILSAKLKKNRKATTFIIEEEFDSYVDDVEELAEADDGKVDLIADSINKLSSQIEDLVNSQDHLSDQVFLQTGSESILPVQEEQPFGFIGIGDLTNLFQILAEENSQLVALVFSYLPPEFCARFLEMFSSERQPEIIRRVGKIDRVTPEVLEMIQKSLKHSLNRMTESVNLTAGGVDKVVEVLNVISRSVEKNVILSLEKTDSSLAEEIKQRMFVFEDIILLDASSVKRIAEQVDFHDLCLSMKIISDERVKTFVFDSISDEQKKKLHKGIEDLGRVKISDVDKAQLRVVGKIREMEGNGEIIVCHPDEIVD